MSSDFFLRLYGDYYRLGTVHKNRADIDDYSQRPGMEVLEGIPVPPRAALDERLAAWLEEIDR